MFIIKCFKIKYLLNINGILPLEKQSPIRKHRDRLKKYSKSNMPFHLNKYINYFFNWNFIIIIEIPYKL